jgi:hypothetical protein
MTMPPSSVGTPGHVPHTPPSHPAGGIMPDMGSGGGTLPAPAITELDIYGGIQGSALNYTWIPAGVPVGAGMAFSVASGYSSVTWSGGTNYGYYLSDPASESPAPSLMYVREGVPTNNNTYGFTLDADEQTYTVNVTVTSDQFPGQQASSTVTFASHRPTASLNLQWTQGITFNNSVNGGTDVQIKADVPIFTAQTASGAFGGNFIFMQTAVIDRSKTDQNGNTTSFTTAGLTFKDDGVDPNEPSPIGMYLTRPSTVTKANGTQVPVNGQYGWSLNAGDTATTTTLDPTLLVVPITYMHLSVDDNYNTYVMYQPPEGVWVALQEVTWSLTGSADNTGTAAQPNWPANYTDPQSDQTGFAPGGDSCFPPWNGLTSSLFWS